MKLLFLCFAAACAGRVKINQPDPRLQMGNAVLRASCDGDSPGMSFIDDADGKAHMGENVKIGLEGVPTTCVTTKKACVGRKGPWPKLWSCSFESALDGTVTETDKVHGDRENDIDSDGVFHGTTASVTCRSPTAPFPKGDARVTVKFDGKALRTLAPPAGTSLLNTALLGSQPLTPPLPPSLQGWPALQHACRLRHTQSASLWRRLRPACASSDTMHTYMYHACVMCVHAHGM